MKLVLATILAGLASGIIAAAAVCVYDDDHAGWPFFFGVLPSFILLGLAFAATMGSGCHLLLRRVRAQSF